MVLVRLQKILAEAGVASRRGGEELIRAGRVSVNGRVISQLGFKADPALDRIKVNGRSLAQGLLPPLQADRCDHLAP